MQPRSGGEVEQALAIGRDGDRRSRLQVCENAAEVYHLTRAEARAIIDQQVEVVRSAWDEAAGDVGLTIPERSRLMGGAILKKSIFYED